MAKRIPWSICVSLVVVSGLSAQEPTLLHTLAGHSNAVEALVFSQDGKTLVSGGPDGAVVFWDVSTGKTLAAFREYSNVLALALLTKGGGVLVSTVNPCVGYSFEESPSPSIIFWDVSKREKTATLGKVVYGLVMSSAVSPNGTTIAIGVLSTDFVGDPFRVELWDTKSHKKIITLPSKDSPSPLAFSPDGTVLATGVCKLGGWANVKLLNVADGKEIGMLKGHTDMVNDVAFSPDGKLLATCSIEDRTVRLWNAVTYKTEAILGREDRIAPKTIAFHPNSQSVASGHRDGIVMFWDVTTGTSITEFKAHPHSVRCMAFSPDGKTLASSESTRQGVVKLWDVASVVGTLGEEKSAGKTDGK